MYEHLALSDSGFLFDTRTGNTYTLSKTGTFLLRTLIAGGTWQELPTQLAATYEVDDETARRDVEQFSFRLKDLGLVAPEVGS